MREVTTRDLRALTLLSIVVPLSLIVSFRLTGMLPEPEGTITIAETTTLDAVKWEFRRDVVAEAVDIFEEIKSQYNTDMSLNQSVFIAQYFNRFGIPYGSNVSVVILAANITVNIKHGFVESVSIVFREDYKPSEIDIFSPESEYRKHVLMNLSIQSWADLENYPALRNSTKAFILLSGVNHPSTVQYWTVVNWALYSPFTQHHQLEITYEVTYFNGTAYKKVVQPFSLRILPP